MSENIKKFIECGSCASKPGTPTLCKSCVNNRVAIGILEKERDKLRSCLSTISTMAAANL